MNDNDLRILNVEDSALDAELCWRELERAGLKFVTERVWSHDTFRDALQNFVPDIILCDFSLPGSFDGFTALSIMHEERREVPFIFVSGTIGEDRAVEAMKRGATDYVLKDRMGRLAPVVMRALQEAREREALLHAQAALRESEERFRQLAENIRDVFFLIDAATESMLYVSPAYEEIWGESRAALYDKPAAWSDIIHPADRQVIPKSPGERVLTGDVDVEYRIVRKDGSIRWINDRIFPIRDESGRLQRIAGVATDISFRKKAEERIERLNHIYAVLSGINTLIVHAYDRDELLREACWIAIHPGQFRLAWVGLVDPATHAIEPVAYAGGEGFSGPAPLALNDIRPDDYDLVRQALRGRKPAVSNDVNKDRLSDTELEFLRGRGINSVAVVPLLLDDDAVGVLALYAAEIGTFDDEELRLLTELAGDISFALDYLAKGEKLHYLAFYDAQTGLPNRALFIERMSRQLTTAGRTGAKLALVVGDVKRFRLINESLGRQAGDTLLREVAERAKNAWPDSDSVAHISADCFAATLIDLKEETAAAHALEKAFKVVTGTPYMIGDNELNIAMTAGIAVFPADGANAETLLRNAEAALKQAKVTGAAYLFYQPSMNAKVVDILRLDNKLRKAMDNDEFVLYYQPKLDLASGAISGLEALIRWNDPDNGIVPPGKFIPLLEETGLILEVGAWAIRRALDDHLRWRLMGIQPPRIAVNVSAIQLRQTNFVDTVRHAISEVQPERHGLDLEITESLIMEDIERNIGEIDELREMAVNIAIDDFGTGYSSLSYLARLPVQTLKIDRSFIATMMGNSDNMTIVSTIVSLAHSLNMKVIAEGVETKEQSRILKLMKCDEIQGYLFSRPMPFEQITALLQDSAKP
ncbi:MAG TPA: EAL domain-containing protein [Gammaproteobacteria bacterium]